MSQMMRVVGRGGEDPTGTASLEVGLSSGEVKASEGKSSNSRAKASSLSRSLISLSGVFGSVEISGVERRWGTENEAGLGPA